MVTPIGNLKTKAVAVAALEADRSVPSPCARNGTQSSGLAGYHFFPIALTFCNIPPSDI
jgi:hypothetical protein